ncbi:homoserine dehydrogenase [Anaerococcus porci]|uniref:Homoserine dehydrogenase n=1 Tax=Anaerococcus porci TaxID=2652269 RepID=A0A6N7VDL7_9FIRM|nr:homoserine dehydrogenase [Anaerococcus porci]MDY3007348.1 homoserine dehydrogenase [Anaerococcus porci]MSS76961.1 homoserine dehydrogenase [Anaerococcus porci]
MKRIVGIAILGFGTVGQGVYKIIKEKHDSIMYYTNAEIDIKKILVRNFNKEYKVEIDRNLLTNNFEEILNDDAIDIIVEVTSSIDQAKDMMVMAMNKGKDIVSANKAAISKYFNELNDLARDNNLHFLHEAAVAGGIPVLKPLGDLVMENDITRVRGILNGTCNFILSKMTEEGEDYENVLKKAQELGYAEADPSSDVDGLDTLRKLRILSTMAFRQDVDENDILLEGISNIKACDIKNLAKLNRTIKLIGDAWVEDEKIKAIVQPVAVYSNSYFASVREAYNSVTVYGDMVGELKFYGAGAGMLPTANAVTNDIIDILFDRQSKVRLGEGLNRQIAKDEIKGDFYVRYNSEIISLDSFKRKKLTNESYLIKNCQYEKLKRALKKDSNSIIIRLESEDY